jgi:hypothetical protein
MRGSESGAAGSAAHHADAEAQKAGQGEALKKARRFLQKKKQKNFDLLGVVAPAGERPSVILGSLENPSPQHILARLGQAIHACKVAKSEQRIFKRLITSGVDGNSSITPTRHAGACRHPRRVRRFFKKAALSLSKRIPA